MRRQQRILQGVGRVVVVAARQVGQPVELAPVPMEQRRERVPVTGDVGCQQLRVGPNVLGGVGGVVHKANPKHAGAPLVTPLVSRYR